MNEPCAEDTRTQLRKDGVQADQPVYDLDALLSMITPENLPQEWEWVDVAPRGREAG